MTTTATVAVDINLRRCQKCSLELMSDDDLTECPRCQSRLMFLRAYQDLQPTINWFHLRCLAHWSERYAHLHCSDRPEVTETLAIIQDLLRPLRPAEAPALTLHDELQEMATTNQEEVIYVDGPTPEVIKPETLH